MPKNNGKVVAEHVHYFITLPESIVAPGQERDIISRKNGYLTLRRENLYCDLLESSVNGDVRFGNPRIVPILPAMIGVYKGIILNPSADFSSDAEIRWVLHADGAMPKQGVVRLKEILKS